MKRGLLLISAALCICLQSVAQVRKIGVIGDSYVRNHKEPIENTWHYKFAQKHGMEYYNYGRNGNCIALDLARWGTGMYQRYKEMRNDLDIVDSRT